MSDKYLIPQEYVDELLDLNRSNPMVYFDFAHHPSLIFNARQAARLWKAYGLDRAVELVHAGIGRKIEEGQIGLDDTAFKRLQAIYRRQHHIFVQHGINTLQLVFGLLEIEKNKKYYRIPFELCPVVLRLVKKSGYRLEFLGPPRLNPALRELLQGEIDEPDLLKNVEDNAQLYEALQKLLIEKGWHFSADTFLVNLNHHRLGMAKDLETNRESLKNPLIQTLFNQKPLKESPESSDLRIFTTLALDRDQQQVLDAWKQQKSFVILGGPGTGKSQTLSNLIESALYSHQKILTITQKPAAAKVLINNLKPVGLECFCLNLHQLIHNKHQLLSDLLETCRLLQAYEPQSENPAQEISQLQKKIDDLRHQRELCEQVLDQKVPGFEWSASALYHYYQSLEGKDTLVFDHYDLDQDQLKTLNVQLEDFDSSLSVLDDFIKRCMGLERKSPSQSTLIQAIHQARQQLLQKKLRLQSGLYSPEQAKELLGLIEQIENRPECEKYLGMDQKIFEAFEKNRAQFEQLKEELIDYSVALNEIDPLIEQAEQILSRLEQITAPFEGFETQNRQRDLAIFEMLKDQRTELRLLEKELEQLLSLDLISLDESFLNAFDIEITASDFGNLKQDLKTWLDLDLENLEAQQATAIRTFFEDVHRLHQAQSDLNEDFLERHEHLKRELLKMFKSSVLLEDPSQIEGLFNKKSRIPFSLFNPQLAKRKAFLETHLQSQYDIPSDEQLLKQIQNLKTIRSLENELSAQSLEAYRTLREELEKTYEKQLHIQQIKTLQDRFESAYQNILDQDFMGYLASRRQLKNALKSQADEKAMENALKKLRELYQIRTQLENPRYRKYLQVLDSQPIDVIRIKYRRLENQFEKRDLLEKAARIKQQQKDLLDQSGLDKKDLDDLYQAAGIIRKLNGLADPAILFPDLLQADKRSEIRHLLEELISLQSREINGRLARNLGVQDLEILQDMDQSVVEAYDDYLQKKQELKNVFIRLRLEKLFEQLEKADFKPEDNLLKSYFAGLFERNYKDNLDLLNQSLSSKALKKELAALENKMADLKIETIYSWQKKQLENIPQEKLELLEKQVHKGSHLITLPELFETFADLIQAIKPCIMSSPLNISEYLQLRNYSFDLAIFDESSQIIASDALCALLRIRQAVICGDEKQLPPTNPTALIYEDKNHFSSLLKQAKPLEVIRLSRHYRSLHPELIEFSNQNFYDNQMQLLENLPSGGVEYHQIKNGFHDPKYQGANYNEAEALVDRLVELTESDPKATMAVIAFSARQKQMIENLLHQRSFERPQLRKWLESQDQSEPFEIWTIEAAQGQQRDIVLISPGFARTFDNRLGGFGRLQQRQGDHYLNVAASRAKRQVILFSSLEPEDLVALSNPNLRLYGAYLMELRDKSHTK